MLQKIETIIKRFRAHFYQEYSTLTIKSLGQDLWSIAPKKHLLAKSEKKFRLTMIAVTHGNEVAGIEILEQFFLHLTQNPSILKDNICLGLGNPQASFQNERFLERDLNRSFGTPSTKFLEERRAKELEPIFKDSMFFLDFHQTIQPSEKPFFIFPFTRDGYLFARHLNSELSIVTHFGKKFSSDGMCTDDFVNENGGIGISIETGGKGFDRDQTVLGLNTCLKALQVAQSFEGPNSLPRSVTIKKQNPIFTWGWTEQYPNEHVELVPHLKNFQKIEKGSILGKTTKGAIKAPQNGYLMFPKYVDRISDKPRPAELYRLLREIKETDLPETC